MIDKHDLRIVEVENGFAIYDLMRMEEPRLYAHGGLPRWVFSTADGVATFLLNHLAKGKQDFT